MSTPVHWSSPSTWLWPKGALGRWFGVSHHWSSFWERQNPWFSWAPWPRGDLDWDGAGRFCPTTCRGNWTWLSYPDIPRCKQWPKAQSNMATTLRVQGCQHYVCQILCAIVVDRLVKKGLSQWHQKVFEGVWEVQVHRLCTLLLRHPSMMEQSDLSRFPHCINWVQQVEMDHNGGISLKRSVTKVQISSDQFSWDADHEMTSLKSKIIFTRQDCWCWAAEVFNIHNTSSSIAGVDGLKTLLTMHCLSGLLPSLVESYRVARATQRSLLMFYPF